MRIATATDTAPSLSAKLQPTVVAITAAGAPISASLTSSQPIPYSGVKISRNRYLARLYFGLILDWFNRLSQAFRWSWRCSHNTASQIFVGRRNTKRIANVYQIWIFNL
jgi:hypothetical protein